MCFVKHMKGTRTCSSVTAKANKQALKQIQSKGKIA